MLGLSKRSEQKVKLLHLAKSATNLEYLPVECSGSAGSGLKVWSRGKNRHRWQCLQHSKTVHSTAGRAEQH